MYLILCLLLEPWSAFRADTASRHSYGRLTAVNRTHLLFEQVSVDFNSTIDQFWLVQNKHGPRIKNWSCQDGYYSNHPTCQCPLPFHYVTVAVFGGAFFLIILAISVYFCCKCCRCYQFCQSKCHPRQAGCCDSELKDWRLFQRFRRDRSRLKECSGRLKLLADDNDEECII